MFKNFKKNEHGFTLVELVVGVAMVLMLAVGGVAVASNGINQQIEEQSVGSKVATGFHKVLDAETNFDETTSADTVIEDLNSEHEDITFRFERESDDEWCVIADHDDLSEEIHRCRTQGEEHEPVEPVEQTTVNRPMCEPDFREGKEHVSHITWYEPSGYNHSRFMYVVAWNDTSGDSGNQVFTQPPRHFVYEAPRDGNAGQTTFTITLLVDGERLDTVQHTTQDVNEPNIRLCDFATEWETVATDF